MPSARRWTSPAGSAATIFQWAWSSGWAAGRRPKVSRPSPARRRCPRGGEPLRSPSLRGTSPPNMQEEPMATDNTTGRRNRPTITDQEALAFHQVGKPASSRSCRPSRWRRSATCRWPIRPASPCPSSPSPRIRPAPSTTRPAATWSPSSPTARRSRPRQSRRARLQAGHGRQGGAVQALRRCRFHRPRARHRGSRQDHRGGALSRPLLRRINLEDIKAPECFIIEQRLQELMDIRCSMTTSMARRSIAAAGLINAMDITGRTSRTTRWWSTARARRASPASSSSRPWASPRERHPLRHQGDDLARPTTA